MEEYSSNSNKSKENQAENEKSVEKIIEGEVRTKKKSGLKSDMANLGSYLIKDIILPAAKNVTKDVVTKAIDTILWGEDGKPSRSSSITPSYRSFYDNRPVASSTTVATRRAYAFDDIILNSRYDAEHVLDSMIDIVKKYGAVSVADMYDLVGVAGNYTDNKYGWTDLRPELVRIERERNGGYILKLPTAVAL